MKRTRVELRSQRDQHKLKAGWKQKRHSVVSGGGDGGVTELDAGAEIDMGSVRPTGAQEVEESRHARAEDDHGRHDQRSKLP